MLSQKSQLTVFIVGSKITSDGVSIIFSSTFSIKVFLSFLILIVGVVCFNSTSFLIGVFSLILFRCLLKKKIDSISSKIISLYFGFVAEIGITASNGYSFR